MCNIQIPHQDENLYQINIKNIIKYTDYMYSILTNLVINFMSIYTFIKTKPRPVAKTQLHRLRQELNP